MPRVCIPYKLGDLKENSISFNADVTKIPQDARLLSLNIKYPIATMVKIASTTTLTVDGDSKISCKIKKGFYSRKALLQCLLNSGIGKSGMVVQVDDQTTMGKVDVIISAPREFKITSSNKDEFKFAEGWEEDHECALSAYNKRCSGDFLNMSANLYVGGKLIKEHMSIGTGPCHTIENKPFIGERKDGDHITVVLSAENKKIYLSADELEGMIEGVYEYGKGEEKSIVRDVGSNTAIGTLAYSPKHWEEERAQWYNNGKLLHSDAVWDSGVGFGLVIVLAGLAWLRTK